MNDMLPHAALEVSRPLGRGVAGGELRVRDALAEVGGKGVFAVASRSAEEILKCFHLGRGGDASGGAGVSKGGMGGTGGGGGGWHLSYLGLPEYLQSAGRL